MSDHDNKLTHLTLRPGIAVTVRGQLVERGGKPVITGYRMLRKSEGENFELRWEHTPFVRILGDDDELAQHRQVLGETVLGRGTWRGDGVELDTLAADHSWVEEGREPVDYVRDTSPVSPHTRTVEGALFASGALLRRVRLIDRYGPRVIVCATNPDLVEKELRPIYGNDLEILKSKWTASQLRGLDDIINDLPDQRILKVQYRMDYRGVISRKLRVDFVDEHLCQTLRKFPDDMLAVEAVVEPQGAPRDRDVHFPTRSRAVRQ